MNRFNIGKIGFLFFFLVFARTRVFSQTAFSKGEELFMQNKPAEALAYLETVVSEDPAHVRAFIYLAVVYDQLGRSDEAIAAYKRILPRAGNESARIAFNIGNIYFTKGNTADALQFYSRAIETNPAMPPAWLNRANTHVKGGTLNEAIGDYEKYLVLEPSSPQRGKIEQLISLIHEETAAAEQRRIAEEEAARAEIERRQRILKEVSASLQAAAEDSRGLSAGAEDVQGYDGEFELE